MWSWNVTLPDTVQQTCISILSYDNSILPKADVLWLQFLLTYLQWTVWMAAVQTGVNVKPYSSQVIKI